jgi:hypothetical protein
MVSLLFQNAMPSGGTPTDSCMISPVANDCSIVPEFE